MEIWKDIEGFEYKYQISNYGRVKIKENVTMRMNMGKMRPYKQKETIMKPTSDGSYLKVGLLDETGKHKNKHIHRLIATHFIPNPNNLPQVNHIDGNKLNNSIDNLEWVSASENSIHARDVLKINRNTEALHPRRALLKIDKQTGEVLQEFSTITQAQRETGITHISCVCRGERKSAGGFVWKYKLNE